MKVRLVLVFLSLAICLSAVACNPLNKNAETTPASVASSFESTPNTPEETPEPETPNAETTPDSVASSFESTPHLETILNTSFSPSPFSKIVEGEDQLTDNEMKAIIQNLPGDKYETYPDLHNVPLTAVLYKGDEVISIDLDDERLIRLINLYNNSVFYNQYAYTQGLLNINYLEKEVLSEDFRLVLTFSTKDNNTSIRYDTNIQAYDTIIITNKGFYLLGHNLPGYEGQEDEYPFRVVGHDPLYYSYNWLDLFGF